MLESIHKFESVTTDLGISVPDLGCVMLDTEGIPVTGIMSEESVNVGADLYYSEDPSLRYAQGAVGVETAHVTLLYGLLRPAKELSEHVYALLEDIDLSKIVIDSVGAFDSRSGDYKCIVGHVRMTDELKLAHSRLQYLPHVNTFPEYRPHITLAYVHNTEGEFDSFRYSIPDTWVQALNSSLAGYSVKTRGLNLGG